MDNGHAVPSDAWLDHASMGLGVEKALEESDEQRKVPQLFDEKNHKGDIDYDRVLDMLVLNASNSNKGEGLDRLESLEGPGVSGGGGKGDDESVYSVTSQMSAISVASSRMTAGQRRRWHKQQQMMQGVKGRSKTTQNPMHPMLSTHPEASSQSATADRQQSSMGSHPYLCEVFHDSYGIGTEPTKGLVECSGFSGRCTREGGAEFYPPSSHIPDLLVFNTTRNSYGLPAGAPLLGASASTSKSSKAVVNEKEQSITHPVSPSAAGRKEVVGAARAGLADLFFKTDAHTEENAMPTLDLPASLPQRISS
jgi:hypothetical protein